MLQTEMLLTSREYSKKNSNLKGACYKPNIKISWPNLNQWKMLKFTKSLKSKSKSNSQLSYSQTSVDQLVDIFQAPCTNNLAKIDMDPFWAPQSI
jgi:hypothetical protein